MALQRGKREPAPITARVWLLALMIVAMLLAPNPWLSNRALAQTIVLATLPVGGGPIGLAVNPVANRIYTASVFDGVTVIDGSTNTVVTTLSGAAHFSSRRTPRPIVSM